MSLLLATNSLQSPVDKLLSQDQEAIGGCWQKSNRATFTPAQQQVVIRACQKLEDVYRLNNGTDPLPPIEGV